LGYYTPANRFSQELRAHRARKKKMPRQNRGIFDELSALFRSESYAITGFGTVLIVFRICETIW
jgi:hypothetical protein